MSTLTTLALTLFTTAGATEVVPLATVGEAFETTTLTSVHAAGRTAAGTIYLGIRTDDDRKGYVTWDATGLTPVLIDGTTLTDGSVWNPPNNVLSGSTDHGLLVEGTFFSFPPPTAESYGTFRVDANGASPLSTPGGPCPWSPADESFGTPIATYSASGPIWFAGVCDGSALAAVDPSAAATSVLTYDAPWLTTGGGTYDVSLDTLQVGGAVDMSVLAVVPLNCSADCPTPTPEWSLVRADTSGNVEVLLVDGDVIPGAEALGGVLHLPMLRQNAAGDVAVFAATENGVGPTAHLLAKRPAGGSWAAVAAIGDSFAGHPNPIDIFRAAVGTVGRPDLDLPRAVLAPNGDLLFTARTESATDAHGCMVTDRGGTLAAELCDGDTLDGPDGPWTIDSSRPPDVLVSSPDGSPLFRWMASNAGGLTDVWIAPVDGALEVVVYRGQVVDLGNGETHTLGGTTPTRQFELANQIGAVFGEVGNHFTDDGRFLLTSEGAFNTPGMVFDVTVGPVVDEAGELEVALLGGWTGRDDGVGDRFEIDVTLTNTGEVPLTTVDLELTFPELLDEPAALLNVVPACDITEASDNGGTVTCTGIDLAGDLDSGDSATLTLPLYVLFALESFPVTLDAVGYTEDGVPAEASALGDIEYARSTDIAVATFEAERGDVRLDADGVEHLLEATVANRGRWVAREVDVMFPRESELDPSPSGDCVEGMPCTLPRLDPGDEAALMGTTIVIDRLEVELTATARNPDPNPANNTGVANVYGLTNVDIEQARGCSSAPSNVLLGLWATAALLVRRRRDGGQGSRHRC